MALELDEVQETNRVVRLQFSKAPSARGVSAATFGEPPPPAYSPNATKKLMFVIDCRPGSCLSFSLRRSA